MQADASCFQKYQDLEPLLFSIVYASCLVVHPGYSESREGDISLRPPEVNTFHALQVVEITKGSKVKYELDKKTGMIKVKTIIC